MRQAKIYYKNHFAGTLTDEDDGYTFIYDFNYLNINNARPISLTMPLQSDAYKSKTLFPFFDGLIPEGWMLEMAIKIWKVNPKDRFAILLATGKDCIGCVSVLEDNI